MGLDHRHNDLCFVTAKAASTSNLGPVTHTALRLTGGFDIKNRLMDAFSKQVPVSLLAIDDGKHAPVHVRDAVYAGEVAYCRRSTGEPFPRHPDGRFDVQPQELSSIDRPAVR